MKVWLLYYTGDLDKISIEYTSDESEKENNRIYAMTSDKNLLEEFLSCRNEKVFDVKKVDLLPSEFDDINHSDLRKTIIDRYTLSTKYGKTITMALTDYEYQTASDDFIVSSIMEDSEYWKNAPDPRKFNKKIRKALDILQYPQSYIMCKPNLPDIDSYDAPDISVDELKQFISNFSGTLKC